MTGPLPRVFVPPDSLAGSTLELLGEDADRLFLRGVRAGDQLVALDDSGWEITVDVQVASPLAVRGHVASRQVAQERRTKVSLYQGLLHPSDFRRLLAGATGLGVVAFVPVITDRSQIVELGADGRPLGEAEWPRLVRDAAESSGRGRRPAVGQTMLFGHALDDALRSGDVLLLDDEGELLAEALVRRPFSIDLFCPPPGGFSDEELAQAAARNATAVRSPGAVHDPTRHALAALEAIYAALEPEPGDS
ncbi:MAG: RsmE family RNA methyltransferase [Anaerolineae bacterium]